VSLSLVIDVNAQHIRLWKLEYRFPFPIYFPLVGVVCAVHNAKRKLAEKRRRRGEKEGRRKGRNVSVVHEWTTEWLREWTVHRGMSPCQQQYSVYTYTCTQIQYSTRKDGGRGGSVFSLSTHPPPQRQRFEMAREGFDKGTTKKDDEATTEWNSAKKSRRLRRLVLTDDINFSIHPRREREREREKRVPQLTLSHSLILSPSRSQSQSVDSLVAQASQCYDAAIPYPLIYSEFYLSSPSRVVADYVKISNYTLRKRIESWEQTECLSASRFPLNIPSLLPPYSIDRSGKVEQTF